MEKRGCGNRIARHFTQKIKTGSFILLSFVIVALVLKFIFNLVDGIFLEVRRMPYVPDVPGIGIAFAIILVYILGMLESNRIGKKFIRMCQQAPLRVPFIKVLYSMTKQLVESFKPNETAFGFNRVVSIEYPRRGVESLGVPVSKIIRGGKHCVVVYIPTPPTPYTGPLVVVPEEEVHETDLPIEKLMQMVVSLGIVSPEEIN